MDLAALLAAEEDSEKLDESCKKNSEAACPSEREACKMALETSCASELEACERESGCSTYLQCVREIATPAAPTLCAKSSNPSETAIRKADTLAACLYNCTTNCRAIGSNWACVGNYDAPTPPRAHLRLSQQLKFLNGGMPISNANVRVCLGPGPCSSEVATTTNESGAYSVPIPVDSTVGGFGGYRLVEKEELYPSLLKRNIPFWTDTHEMVHLLSQESHEWARDEIELAPKRRALIVQVFDCNRAPAPDVYLTIESKDDDQEKDVIYLTNKEYPPDYHRSGTTWKGDGTAVAYEFVPGGEYRITARVKKEPVAEATIEIPEEDFQVYLNLYPNPGPRP